jgi:dTDP-4-amino-4,6-dideoxygalactose transaminase
MIPIARPALDVADAEAATRAILSGWVSQGPEVASFEREFAAHVGAPYACAVSSCTAALHLALLALGVGRGDEVITVSHSYIATANAVRYCGAEPVFIDIDPLTYNMDPTKLAPAVTARTKAILCVHQMGMPCDLESILPIAREHVLPVVEDAACAIGSEICIDGSWQRIGKPHGDIACFSFHPRKVITTGDGGMLSTANPDWCHAFQLLRQHAMSVSDVARHSSSQVTFESYAAIGYNYRMTDIQAAVGRSQLRRLPDLIARRRELAHKYHAWLSQMSGVLVPYQPVWARSNWQSYCVRLPSWTNQRAVMQFMLDNGVATRRGIMCAHLEGAYSECELRFPLPESEAAQRNCILLPLYADMTEIEQSRVVDVFGEACRRSVESDISLPEHQREGRCLNRASTT